MINEAASGRLLTPKGGRCTAGTIANWKKTKARFSEFSPGITFDSLSLKSYHSFIDFCNQRGYAMSYTGKLINEIETFMQIGLAREWHKNSIHRHPLFKKLYEIIEQVYLDDQEIKSIYDLDLTFDKAIEVVRDRFIVNLYTGFRISDMKTLNLENIKADTITHINQKTGNKVVIPLYPIISDLIKKYNGDLPKQYNDVFVNATIKLIAQKAGITETIRFSKTVGGVKKQFIHKKWEMITNHTCRRSMAIGILNHTDLLSAMPVMGMSLKTLQLYNKRTAE